MSHLRARSTLVHASSNSLSTTRITYFMISTKYVPIAMSSREPRSTHRRSRSPTDRSHYQRHRSPRSHHHHSSKRTAPAAPAPLPFRASPLSKSHYERCKPMLVLYLDIQKHKVLEDLSEDEVRGRWKSFVGKWYDDSPLVCRAALALP